MLRNDAARQLAIEMDLDPDKVKELPPHGLDPDEKGQIFVLSNGKKLHVNRFILSNIEQLRQLPIADQLKIMGYTQAQLELYLKVQKAILKNEVIRLLSLTWYWRETGEEALIHAGIIPGSQWGQTDLLEKVKSRRRFRRQELQDIADWFLDGKEVYLKDSNTDI